MCSVVDVFAPISAGLHVLWLWLPTEYELILGNHRRVSKGLLLSQCWVPKSGGWVFDPVTLIGGEVYERTATTYHIYAIHAVTRGSPA